MPSMTIALKFMLGRAVSKLIVCGAIPGMSKAMVSVPKYPFDWVIAQRRETPSVVVPSSELITVNVVAKTLDASEHVNAKRKIFFIVKEIDGKIRNPE